MACAIASCCGRKRNPGNARDSVPPSRKIASSAGSSGAACGADSRSRSAATSMDGLPYCGALAFGLAFGVGARPRGRHGGAPSGAVVKPTRTDSILNESSS